MYTPQPFNRNVLLRQGPAPAVPMNVQGMKDALLGDLQKQFPQPAAPSQPAPVPQFPEMRFKDPQPRQVPSQFMPQQAPVKPMQNQLLQGFLNSFQQTYDPQGYRQRQADVQAEQDRAYELEQRKQQAEDLQRERATQMQQEADAERQRLQADQKDQTAKQLALMENLKGLSVDQRIALIPQIKQMTGADIPPELMQDAAIDQQIALFRSQAGQLPPQQKVTISGGRVFDAETGELLNDTNNNFQIVQSRDGRIFRVNKATGEPEELYRAPPPPAKVSTAKPPNSGTLGELANGKPPPQPTEGERTAAFNASISLEGLKKLSEFEIGGYNRAGMVEQGAGYIGGERERLYDQAAAQFIDGYLRVMTGATAGKDEVTNYQKQYFPQFGDSPAVVEQKRQMRFQAIKNMKIKAGRAWDPEWDVQLSKLGIGPDTSEPDPEIEQSLNEAEAFLK